MDQQSVEVGQRFERLGRWRRIWEVEAIIQGPGQVANVVLHDVSDPANKCTLAPPALLDPSRFRLVGRSEPGPIARPVRHRARSRMSLPSGGVAGNRVIAMPRRRLETSMTIESRSADGYVVICRDQDQDHRFVAKHPGIRLACPRCGNRAMSMALLLDYIGAAPPRCQIDTPDRRRAVDRRRPGPHADSSTPRSALILTYPRKRGPA